MCPLTPFYPPSAPLLPPFCPHYVFINRPPMGLCLLNSLTLTSTGLLWVYVSFFLLFSAMITVNLTALHRLQNDFHPVGDLRPFTPLLWMLLTALCAEYTAYILYLIHYSRYASDGLGMPALKIMAEVMHGISECLLFLLVVCIAKGPELLNSLTP